MKKFILSLSLAFLLICPNLSQAFFTRTFDSLTGQVVGSVDNVGCTEAGLVDGDGTGIVITEDDEVYFYYFDKSAQNPTSSPDYIRCKNYTTSGVWILKAIAHHPKPMCLSWYAPIASDDFLFYKNTIGSTLTIKNIYGVLQSGTNVVGGFDECDSSGASCVAVDSDITFNGGEDTDDGSLSNPSIDDNDWIRWHTTSVSAPGWFSVCFTFE